MRGTADIPHAMISPEKAEPQAANRISHQLSTSLAAVFHVGTFDNSPAIHRWVPNPGSEFSPVGTIEAFDYRDLRRLHFSRPYGTLHFNGTPPSQQ